MSSLIEKYGAVFSGSASDDEVSPMITPSEVIEHLYCPRFTYYMNCLNIPQHEERRYKVLKGRNIHEKKEKQNRDYLRKKLGTVDKEISVYLASPKLGVRGIVDEVLTLSDCTMAPLDYKYSEYTEQTYNTFRVQSALYALLISECYEKSVKKGFICYCRGNARIKEIVYREKDFIYAIDVVREVFRIILDGFYPGKTKWLKRCLDCCYRNICA